MARTISESGIYHVVSRGSGRQLIFEDDADRMSFISTLGESARRAGVDILGWCLMPNHVRLILLDCERHLSDVMQRVLTSYARRFNCRTGHVGHVFQGRFSSAPIEGERYLLAAVRYLHLNPERAGICPAEQYDWSSYREYAGGVPRVEVADTSLVLEMLGGRSGFVELCRDDAKGMEPYAPMGLCRGTDEVVIAARGLLDDAGLGDPGKVKTLPQERRDEALRLLRSSGLSARAVERLTGVGRGVVERVTARAK